MKKKNKIKDQERIISILKKDIDILLNGSHQDKIGIRFKYDVLKSMDKLIWFGDVKQNITNGI